MPRLKKLKFENAEDIMIYYYGNSKEIYERTFSFLEKHYNKNGFIDTINIYEIEVPSYPEMKYISVLKEEWENCLMEMMYFYVKTELYEDAANIRNFIKKVFGKVKEL